MYVSRYATAGSIYRIVWKDTDGDGLADDWEQQYFGSTTGAITNTDVDGDGFSNLQEFLAGTDPTNSVDNLHVTSIDTNNSDFVVSFTSAIRKKYNLERTDDMVPTNWIVAVSNLSGTGSIIPATDVGSATLTQRFYRVRLLP